MGKKGRKWRTENFCGRRHAMASFKGQFRYSVDQKGRVALPVRLRKSISPVSNDTLVITRGFEPCIFLYPLDEWAKVEEQIRTLATANPKHRFVQREIMSWSVEATLDAQSRISIPQEHMQYAGIEREVLILGILDRIEIWNPTRFEEYMKTQPETYESVAAEVLPR